MRILRWLPPPLLLWGLTVSLVKSKGMVMGTGTDAHELSSIPAGNDFIDSVEDFQCLGSCISRDGEISREVSKCLAKAARMFGCLCSSLFVNKSLSIDTKRCVYIATVTAAGSERR